MFNSLEFAMGKRKVETGSAGGGWWAFAWESGMAPGDGASRLRAREREFGSREELARGLSGWLEARAALERPRWRSLRDGLWELRSPGEWMALLLCLSPRGRALSPQELVASERARRAGQARLRRERRRLGGRKAGPGPEPGTGRGAGPRAWRSRIRKDRGAGARRFEALAREREIEGLGRALGASRPNLKEGRWDDPMPRRGGGGWKERGRARRQWEGALISDRKK